MNIQDQDWPIVFCYDRCDYFYIGATQADKCPITGDPQPCGFSTFLPPPSFETAGEQIAVFLHEEGRWEMRPNDFWTPTIVEQSITLNEDIDFSPSIKQYPAHALARFPGVPRVLYPPKHAMALSSRLAYMQTRLEEIIKIDQTRRTPNCFLTPDQHHHEKFAIEELVLNMKRVVDEIFMNEWVRLEKDSAEFKKDHILKVCDIQAIDKLPASQTKTKLIEMRDTDPDFFRILTDLRNSFIHHFSVCESYMTVGLDHPTVSSLYIHQGKLKDIRFIVVWLADLVQSFNRFLIRTFGE